MHGVVSVGLVCSLTMRDRCPGWFSWPFPFGSHLLMKSGWEGPMSRQRRNLFPPLFRTPPWRAKTAKLFLVVTHHQQPNSTNIPKKSRLENGAWPQGAGERGRFRQVSEPFSRWCPVVPEKFPTKNGKGPKVVRPWGRLAAGVRRVPRRCRAVGWWAVGRLACGRTGLVRR